ncbi:hypothetical protein [Pontibacter litorisediminis]|uniref:hypothetical protein n=1 Tax=Pontibacter litorisediminis TaxID=1846260 RepID=UPI0023ED2574|nr:hypothetical protein [Pontibacter litorisediminis]
METNKNNNPTSQNQSQSKANTSNTTSSNTSSNMQGSANQSQGSSSKSGNSSQNMQGRSNQQATTGKGGMKDIQDKLSQFGSTAATKFNNLTTKQKAMVGGAVLALGAGWMAMSQKNKNKIKGQISSAASSAKDAMHNVNAKQHNTSGSSKSNMTASSSGSSSTNARVK